TNREIARSVRDARAYKTYDLAQSMLADTGLTQLGELRVDGPGRPMLGGSVLDRQQLCHDGSRRRGGRLPGGGARPPAGPLWVAAPGRGGEHGTGEEGDVGKAGHGL